MKAKILLRIAAMLTLVHLLGHGIGHSTWDTPDDPKMKAVVDAMKSNSAEFMGAVKSMADYHSGYSLMIFGLFAMTIVILWNAGNFIYENKSIAKKVLAPMGLAYVFFGIVEYLSFFPFAAVTSLLVGVLILVALGLKK